MNGNRQKLSSAEILKLPVKCYATILGVIIGHVGKITKETIEIYAPAKLSTVSATGVVYTPVAFCADVLELHRNNLGATLSLAEVIATGYRGYAEKYVEGAYEMTALLAGVDTTEEAIRAMTPPGARWPQARPVISPTRTDIVAGDPVEQTVSAPPQECVAKHSYSSDAKTVCESTETCGAEGCVRVDQATTDDAQQQVDSDLHLVHPFK